MGNPSRKSLAGLLFLLGLVPIVFIGFVIERYGVNIPYADEWENLLLVERWDAGHLRFADLIRTHNGHRILVPRLIYLAFAEVAHGNIKGQMFFSLSVCVMTSAGILYLLRRTLRTGWPQVFAAWGLSNVLLFSPVQSENWLWGFQFQIFFSNLCIVGALIAVTANAHITVRIALAAFFALVATLSFGNGILIWPIVAVFMIARRETRRGDLIWGAMTVLVLGASFGLYHGKDLSRPVGHWWDYPTFFVAFLGAHLAEVPHWDSMVPAVIVGAILVLGYFALLISCLRHGIGAAEAVWLALGAFPIGSAVMAAASRTHFGKRYALDPRFTTVAVILSVSLIGTAASRYFERPSTKAKLTGFLAGCVCLALYAATSITAFSYLDVRRAARSLGKAATEFSKVMNVDEIFRWNLLLGEEPEIIARYLSTLDRHQLTYPPRRETAILRDGVKRLNGSTQEYGLFENVTRGTASQSIASGWSYLPHQRRPAACVVFAFRDSDNWIAFAMSGQRMDRPDISKAGSGSGHNLGWRGTFSSDRLPPGITEISAWAVDADEGATYRLSGSFRVEK